MAVVDLSVIIPTFNRCGTLARNLEALACQEEVDGAEIEVIVVDDGSSDGTRKAVEALTPAYRWSLRYYRQAQSGPAAARNLAIREANGTLVLMINDDTIAAPQLLAQHIACHARYPDPHCAVLGLFTWLPELEITPFMRWAERAWFKYDQLLSGKVEPDFTFFFTCNISLKRQFLLDHGLFDPEFRGPALEDTELGYRLAQQGLCLIFCPDAIGYHAHEVNLASACRRSEMVGRWSNVVVRKVPPNLVIDHFWPSIVGWPGMKILIPRLVEPLAYHLERIAAIHPVNKLVTTYYFCRGAEEEGAS